MVNRKSHRCARNYGRLRLECKARRGHAAIWTSSKRNGKMRLAGSVHCGPPASNLRGTRPESRIPAFSFVQVMRSGLSSFLRTQHCQRDFSRLPTGKLWRSFMRTADCPPVIFLSPRSHLTFHDRHYWMKRRKRSLDMAISLVSPRAKLNKET